MIIVAAAAIALPMRRPDLYQASPANVKFLGIPVLYIVAPLSIVEFLVVICDLAEVPGAGHERRPSNIWWIPAFLAALIVASG